MNQNSQQLHGRPTAGLAYICSIPPIFAFYAPDRKRDPITTPQISPKSMFFSQSLFVLSYHATFKLERKLYAWCSLENYRGNSLYPSGGRSNTRLASWQSVSFIKIKKHGFPKRVGLNIFGWCEILGTISVNFTLIISHLSLLVFDERSQIPPKGLISDLYLTWFL